MPKPTPTPTTYAVIKDVQFSNQETYNYGQVVAATPELQAEIDGFVKIGCLRPIPPEPPTDPLPTPGSAS